MPLRAKLTRDSADMRHLRFNLGQNPSFYLAIRLIFAIVVNMTEKSSSDSVSILGAAERLQSALRQLETTLMPMQARLKLLETQSESAKALDEDRARLASELDEAKGREQELGIQASTREQEFAAKEAEFAHLAEETMREMDLVITQVKQTLSQA